MVGNSTNVRLKMEVCNLDAVFIELQSAIQKSNRLLQLKLKKEFLKRRSVIYLIAIFLNQGITMQDLALLMQVDKGTITKTIKSLCAAGVIKKLQDEKDKRIWHLYSADNFDEFYLEINSQYNQICSSLFNNYSEEKIELLKSYITRITNNINALKSLH